MDQGGPFWWNLPENSGKEFCTRCVVPFTAGTGCSVALLLNEEPKEADIMVSHAWGENMLEVQEILACSVADGKIDPSWSLWFCILALYQPGDGCGPTVHEQVESHPFGSVINAVKSHRNIMIVLHTSTAEVYDRLWCVFEIDHALEHNVDVVPEVSQAYLEKLENCLEIIEGGLVVPFDKVDLFHQFFRVQCEMASCSMPEDREWIEWWVRRNGGFERLDLVIRYHRQKLLTRSLKTIFTKERHASWLSGLSEEEACDEAAWTLRRRGCVDLNPSLNASGFGHEGHQYARMVGSAWLDSNGIDGSLS